MNDYPQASQPSDGADLEQEWDTAEATERHFHRIRRSILRKLEARISLENWSSLLRCRPSTSL